MLSKKNSLARTLTLLTFLFIAAQLSFFIITLSTSGIIHILIKNSITLEILTTPVVLKPVIIFVLTHCLLYICLVFFIWYLAVSIGELFRLRYRWVYSVGLLLWLLVIALIMTANSYYFNLSIFSLKNIPLRIELLSIILLIALILSTTNLILAIYHDRIKLHHWIIIGFIFLMMSLWLPSFFNNEKFIARRGTQPNIFIIGIEALRPDFINNDTMPYLSQLLSNSFQFTNAYTPIAQSFPSWISILTSQLPKHNGARSLYTHFSDIHVKPSLLTKLKAAGYDSYYAVDGQRFGDITKQIGFDHIISPPSGAAELVIGSLSDFPIINLMTLTPFTQYLLPYQYANRSISVSYHPDDFVNLLNGATNQSHHKPILFCVHFGLSHWPFRWANDMQPSNLPLAEQYRYSLRAADAQIKQFMQTLEHKGLLKHALVILASDHGIGLGLPGDRLISKPKLMGEHNHLDWLQEIKYSNQASYGLDTSYGYSTDILSLKQYHTLLAFKKFGENITKIGTSSTRVSLLDIAPTILDFLNLKPFKLTDGVSLVSVINHQAAINPHRIVILENGYTTPEISRANISTANVLNEMPAIAIDRTTGLLFITENAQRILLQQKQRAALLDDWLLARYPQSVRYKLVSRDDTSQLTIKEINIPAHYILANIVTKEWTMDLASDFAKLAPLSQLMSAFVLYHFDEINADTFPE